jgi:hypothetical protein
MEIKEALRVSETQGNQVGALVVTHGQAADLRLSDDRFDLCRVGYFFFLPAHRKFSRDMIRAAPSNRCVRGQRSLARADGKVKTRHAEKQRPGGSTTIPA